MLARFLTLAAMMLLLPGLAPGQDKDKGPLQVRLIAKRTTYPLEARVKDKGALAAPAVALIVELKNSGKERLEVVSQGPQVLVKGPEASSVTSVDGGPVF